MNPADEPITPRQASRWETFVWPRWLPVRARMPLIAQVTGAVALTSLIVGPWWASAPDAIPATTETVARPAAPAAPAPTPAPVETTPSSAVPLAAPASTPAPVADSRPAHLNLDIRHSFAKMDVSVTVDGKPALNARLEGSGKRFGVFGKRSERGYTRTIDLAPGERIVRVRMHSISDKFDQVRVERFDLGAAAVATMRISADKSGLTLVAERPPARPPQPIAAVPVTAAPVAAPQPIQAAAAVPAPQTASVSQDGGLAELLQSVRSMLIWIASFIATTATAFLFEEWLRTRKEMLMHTRNPAGRRRRIQDAIDAP